MTKEKSSKIIDEIISYVQKYHMYTQNPRKYSNTFTESWFKIIPKTCNLIPEIYTTVKDNSILYNCTFYDHCKNISSKKNILQKVFSIQLRLPKSIHSNEELQKIDKTIHDSLIEIKLKSLLDKINILTYLDMDSDEKETLIQKYRKMFDTFKESYEHSIHKRDIILNKELPEETNEDIQYQLAFIKKILKLEFTIHYHFTKNSDQITSYDTIIKGTDTEFDIIFAQNLATLEENIQKDIENETTEFQDSIFMLKNIKENQDNTYELQDSIENDEKKLFSTLTNKKLLLQVIKKSFIQSSNKHIQYTQKKINIDDLYSIKIEQSSSRSSYKNNALDYFEPLFVNNSIENNTDILVIYNYAQPVTVNKEVQEYIKKPSVYKELDKKNQSGCITKMNWRRILSNEYMQPFIVDTLTFNSIEHYLQYSKFNKRTDIQDPVIVQKYQKFANLFCKNVKGLYAELSGEEAYKMGAAENTSRYDITIADDWLDKRSTILKKALYAKCFQNKNIQEILQLTNPALLISPFKGKKRKHKYRFNNELMYIRQLFMSSTLPIDIYTNYKEDKTIFESLFSSTHNMYIEPNTTTTQTESTDTSLTESMEEFTSSVQEEQPLEDVTKDIIYDVGAEETKEAVPDTEELQEDEELQQLSEQADETLEEAVIVIDEELEESLFLDKFLEPKVANKFSDAQTEISSGNQKTSDWMWYFFPQAPFGTSPISLRYSLQNKKEVLQYIYNDELRNRYIVLLDTMINHKKEVTDITIEDIMGKQTRSELARLDTLKCISSITLFYLVASSKFNELNERWSDSTVEKPPNVDKILKNTKEIIDKISQFKDTFDEFVDNPNVVQLVQDISETDPFLPVIEEQKYGGDSSASGADPLTGGYIDTGVQKSSVTHDISKLNNIEHLVNLTGGSIENNILQIALKNNDNNVYRALSSLTNKKTLQIYKMLSKEGAV